MIGEMERWEVKDNEGDRKGTREGEGEGGSAFT